MKHKNKIEVKSARTTLIKDVNEDSNQIKKLFIILLGVAVIAGLLYFATAKYIVKDNFQKETETTEEISIDYDKIRVGNLMNRSEEEYYVFAYDSNDVKASYYDSLIGSYKNTGKTKIYYLDTALEVNKSIVGKKSNKNPKNVEDLSISCPTLIKISKNQIVGYYEAIDEIASKLK